MLRGFREGQRVRPRGDKVVRAQRRIRRDHERRQRPYVRVRGVADAVPRRLDEAPAGLSGPVPFPECALLREGGSEQARSRTGLRDEGEISHPLPGNTHESNAHRPFRGLWGMGLRNILGRQPSVDMSNTAHFCVLLDNR